MYTAAWAVITVFPALSLSFDKDVSEKAAHLFPNLYTEGQLGQALSRRTFGRWALMGALRPFPEQADARTQWTEEVCTWERFERAVARAGADVGVGADGYSGYLTRKASAAARRGQQHRWSASMHCRSNSVNPQPIARP